MRRDYRLYIEDILTATVKIQRFIRYDMKNIGCIKNWWVMDSCLRRNDTYGRKIPFLVIPVKHVPGLNRERESIF